MTATLSISIYTEIDKIEQSVQFTITVYRFFWNTYAFLTPLIQLTDTVTTMVDDPLFRTVAKADFLLSDLYRNSSQAAEFIELFTLQFIVEQLNQDQLKTFEKLLREKDPEKINLWIRAVIPEFDRQYAQKLQDYVLNIHTQ